MQIDSIFSWTPMPGKLPHVSNSTPQNVKSQAQAEIMMIIFSNPRRVHPEPQKKLYNCYHRLIIMRSKICEVPLQSIKNKSTQYAE